MRPVTFDQPPANASAWAAEMPDGTTRLVLINKDARQKFQIAIPSPRDAKLWRMQAPGLTATAGVTLAGAEIKPEKSWKPSHEENLSVKNGQVQIEMEPGSAVAFFFDGSI